MGDARFTQCQLDIMTPAQHCDKREHELPVELTFSCVRKLSTTTCEWSALCLLASYALPADKVCKSAMAAFIAWMSCLMTPANCI